MPRARRSRGVAFALIAFALLSVFSMTRDLRGWARPSAGFAYNQFLGGELEVNPLTDAAASASRGLGELFVRQINGVEVTPSRISQPRVARLLREEPGAVNHFQLVDVEGRTYELALPLERPRLLHLVYRAPDRMLYPVVALLWLALGVWVWWKRPEDRAATPMLLFALVGAFALQFNLSLDELSSWIALGQRAALPFYAPALVAFALKFTGYHQHPRLGRAVRWAFWCAVALAAVHCFYAGASHAVYRWNERAIGGLLACSVLFSTALGGMAMQTANPLALRRRGRLLAKTSLVAFFIPSLSIIVRLPCEWILNVSLMTTFPAAMAYAIVRHGVFNFRVVLRQGLVHGLLSVGLLLGYLAVVLTILEVAAGFAGDAFSVSVVALVVIGVSVLELQVQGWVNRFVFRSRYLFSDAIAQASARLASARTRADVTQAVSSALLGQLQLSRAALAVSRPGRDSFECIALGPQVRDKEPRTPEDHEVRPLPREIRPAQLAPVRRALATRSIVTAYDSAAASAQLAAHDGLNVCDVARGECNEGTFWNQFGLEAVMPLRVGAESAQGRVVGFLLLGPKRDGKPLDSADEHLIFTLANQLAVALENSAAFDEIRSLKESLERQVEERTKDLSKALTDLQRAQGQLIESEKHAMLGRLVAGMAHEMNTPLGTLRSSADTLARVVQSHRLYLAQRSRAGDAEAAALEHTSGALERLLEVMSSSAERLNQLLSSLKRFASLDQGARQRLDVRESIDSALAVLGPSLTPNITIHQNYVDSDLCINGDPAKLNQLFWELLQNSLTALQGKGEIRIDARREHDLIEVDLTDNGVGIPEERMRELFDFGFTQKNGRVGLRLGLPTSKLTVTELGGEISIESVPGEGTSVHLRLPA